jgi:glutamate/tyrosine decarboxylase-like PLP-dependent enzyme
VENMLHEPRPEAIEIKTQELLDSDRLRLPALLQSACDHAIDFLSTLDNRPVGLSPPAIPPLGLPSAGLGAAGAVEAFKALYELWLSGSAGPRYFAFVTGGSTPAALVGDWLTATYDQNASDAGESSTRQIASDALGMVRDLIGLPSAFDGVFVSGATTSATVAMATARQWVGRVRGIDASTEGAHAIGPINVLSGTAHSSIPKALSVVGLGRRSLHAVGTLPGREAVDVETLDAALHAVKAEGLEPAIVVANAGTVNTCDFDDLQAIAALRARHRFWLHVDAAFGAFAAASPRFHMLLAGLSDADSITIDGHKWLNVPYDSAVILTRHLDLQGETFQSTGAYLPAQVRPDTFIHLTPENSQRLRALATWMTLAAYGRAGYQALVERCCDHAAWLGAQIERHRGFRLMAPVRLNGVCFTLTPQSGAPVTTEMVTAYLARLRETGVTFLTPTTLWGVPAARVAICNWRTSATDMQQTWVAMQEALSTVVV